jgi:hypothetical protein
MTEVRSRLRTAGAKADHKSKKLMGAHVCPEEKLACTRTHRRKTVLPISTIAMNHLKSKRR